MLHMPYAHDKREFFKCMLSTCRHLGWPWDHPQRSGLLFRIQTSKPLEKAADGNAPHVRRLKCFQKSISWWHSWTWLTSLELHVWSNIKTAFLCSETCVFSDLSLWSGFPAQKGCLIITPNLPILKHSKTKTTVIAVRITVKTILIITNLCSFDQTDSIEDWGLSGFIFTSRLDWNKNKTALNKPAASICSNNVQPKLNQCSSHYHSLFCGRKWLGVQYGSPLGWGTLSSKVRLRQPKFAVTYFYYIS